MAGTCQWFQSDFQIKSIAEALHIFERIFFFSKENDENAWWEKKKKEKSKKINLRSN